MNYFNWGKMIDGALHRASNTIIVDSKTIINPKESALRQAGYLPIEETLLPDDGLRYDGYYEEINGTIYRVWIEHIPTIQEEVEELKKKLYETDYIACKIAEGAATREDYAKEIAEREQWRERVRELENELMEVVENASCDRKN